MATQRRKESIYGGSSSDENRSSGHASMSDGHTSSSPPAETLPRHTHYRTCLNAVPEDDKYDSFRLRPFGPRARLPNGAFRDAHHAAVITRVSIVSLRLSANGVAPQQSHPPKSNNGRRVVTGKAVSRHRGLVGVKVNKLRLGFFSRAI